jgi:cobalt-zinc-cadmium efflux system membrane fusion protein
VVISRDAVAGEMADPSKPIFVVADISTMWVVADVGQEDARRLALGQDVVFRSNDNGDEPVGGTLAWMSTAVDDKTRTLRVRAEVANKDGRLLAHTFGKARITFRKTEKAVVVPDEAVQWEGCCHIVFVRLTDDIFQPRKVKLGVKQAGFTEVLIGVLPGEVVTTAGSHVLKSEVLRGNLGAGCTDD